MVNKLQADVAKFHLKFGRPIMSAPRSIPQEYSDLRVSLIEEESAELTAAIQSQNLVKIADGIADLIYVALGTALEFGIEMGPVWEEVQRTNMLKVGGGTRTDGKILKPDGWEPPRIKEVLDGQTNRVGSLYEYMKEYK